MRGLAARNLICLGLLVTTSVPNPVPGRARQSSAATSSLTFEVASLKVHRLGEPVPPNLTGASARGCSGTDVAKSLVPMGRCVFRNAGLKVLIAYAFQVQAQRILGGPNWLDAIGYDLEAKAEEPATLDQLYLMLQTLLRDRFQLTFHRETKQVEGYVLVVGKNGAKLTQAAAKGPGSSFWTSIGPNTERLTVRNRPMSEFASRLEQGQPARPLPSLGHPVVDRTGLKGNFDYHLDLEWTIDSNGKRDGSAFPVFAAIQEQLGLKLESQKVPIEFFVIDSADKPTPH